MLNFLRSEYDDSYKFEIERQTTISMELMRGDAVNGKVELIVSTSPCYKLRIVNDNMQHLFSLYRTGEFIEERGQYCWQKELIDMIEGG